MKNGTEKLGWQEKESPKKIKAVKIGFYFFNWGIFIFKNEEKIFFKIFS